MLCLIGSEQDHIAVGTWLYGKGKCVLCLVAITREVVAIYAALGRLGSVIVISAVFAAASVHSRYVNCMRRL